MRDKIRFKTETTWYQAMSVCLINLLLLGLINALIIKAIAMHWHNSIFLDQSIPHGQHARSEVFFWRSKVFSTLSRVARWYQQHWTKCTHLDSSNRAWRPKITHNRARCPQKCAFQLHFQSLPTLLCLFSRGAKYSMCHKYLTWLEQDRDPCQLSPIGVRIRSLIKPAIIARHPTCGRDTPICAGIHYVRIQIWTSYLSSHILTMRRHRFSNHLWQVLAGDSLGTSDPPDIFAA